MSRIYQGGSADRRYEGRSRGASYQPRQVASNERELKQQGQQILQNLETQERERLRADQMSNLESASSARVAELNLQAEQNAAAAQLQFQQNAEKMALNRVQMGESQLLKETSMKGQHSLANNILEMKQNLQANLLQQTHEWNKGNLDLKNKLSKSQLKQQQSVANDILSQKSSLERMQTTEKLGQQHGQLIQTQNLNQSQLGHRHAMEHDFMIQNHELGAEMRAMQANQALEQQHLATKQAHQRAAMQRQQAGVSALMSFAGIALKGASMYVDYQEQKEQEEAEKQGYEWLFSNEGSVVQPDGSVNPTIGIEEAQQESENAYEVGVQTVSGGNPVTAEAIRQPEADATMDRNIRQASIGEAALNFKGEFDTRISQRVHLARNEAELNQILQQTAREITAEFGVSGKDKHAMLVNYGRQVKAAMQSAQSSYGAQMRAANKQERYDAGIENGRVLAANGNYQQAWNTARSAAISSGLLMGKSNKEINDIVLKDLMAELPDSQLANLKDVRKIAGNKGSTFGSDRRYNDMIDDEIRARRNDVAADQSAISSANSAEVVQITNQVTEALYTAPDAETALSIRQDAIARLEGLGTPEALDAAVSLRQQGGLNNNVYLDLVEGFETGNPPTSQQISAARASGAISHQQMENLQKRGETSDLIQRRISAAGVQAPEQIAKTVISEVLSQMPLDTAERATQSANIAANLAPEIEQKLRAFVVNNPQATPGQIQQEVARIQAELRTELNISPDQGRLKYDKAGGVDFDYRTTRVAPVTTRVNPATGSAQKVYTQINVDEIPTTASSLDVHLTRQEFLADLEVFKEGTGNYSARTRAVAARLNISPGELVKKQTYALGYPSVEEVPKSVANLPTGSTSMSQGFQAIKAIGFPTRGAAYLAGNIMQESSWNGQRSWGEVAGDGSDRNGGLVSWMDGVAHNNFRLTKIEKYLGKNISQASTAEQLQAMVWEMKRDYSSAYRVFMNPNSTDVQLRRASRQYWGYGHEGSRYSYAQSLL